nr:reverse transcriptase domain-containing protein [Tanacetum cinerariifolium]
MTYELKESGLKRGEIAGSWLWRVWIMAKKKEGINSSLLANKDKLFELAKIPLNENFSAMLLKKLPKKLRDPGKFLIPCDFPGMDVCHALADLGASINIMPLSIWKKLSLPKLTSTRMTLELANRSITRPKGVTGDVFVKVGKFHFPTDFVVVDFEANPRVPLILGRSFLRTVRALIDVYGEEITIRVDDKAVTFNLNQTTRYSSTYVDMSVNRIDIIDVAREEYAQEMLGFSNNSLGGNPTSTSEPIISDSSPSLTPFEGSDFILEEIEAYLKDDSISPETDHADCDPEGDIFKAKSSIEEPPELELKDLPSHLEYTYLEGVNKLPMIIEKDLKVDEKEALLKVERFKNYLEEQTDGEALINSIKNGDQPLPRVTQVSIAGTSSTEQPPLKDKSMYNKTAKDLWDALARHMLGSEYGEQDKKAAVLYEYETFNATEGELLLDTYIRYLQVINDMKKCGYSKDNCELNFKFLNNLQLEWKQYATMMRQNKKLMDINIDALYNILKQNQGDVNVAITVVVTSDPLALITKKTKVNKRKEKVVVSLDSKGSDADDFSKLKKITALLEKDFNRRKFYSKP